MCNAAQRLIFIRLVADSSKRQRVYVGLRFIFIWLVTAKAGLVFKGKQASSRAMLVQTHTKVRVSSSCFPVVYWRKKTATRTILPASGRRLVTHDGTAVIRIVGFKYGAAYAVECMDRNVHFFILHI